jgi:hypothetical protein
MSTTVLCLSSQRARWSGLARSRRQDQASGRLIRRLSTNEAVIHRYGPGTPRMVGTPQRSRCPSTRTQTRLVAKMLDRTIATVPRPAPHTPPPSAPELT